MAQIRGGSQNQPRGLPQDTPAEPNPVGANRGQTSRIQRLLDKYTGPAAKPCLPAIGRFLIVVHFFEVALRLLAEWSDQLLYLHEFRKFPIGLNHIFLVVNIVTMIVCSSLVILGKYPTPAVAGLLGIIALQGVGYDLILDLNFLLRNLSVVGGLLMVLSESRDTATVAFAGLPTLNEKARESQMEGASRGGSFA